ncbi:hypothetical protein BU23DRAFT_133263 [Bimuria novae-zelandiae CBS 107.79]|uniref:Uncharacterized protein n=1 Tax=Bimuria novae-zelandiae CBS 107.79 TaxID=1447943 RepID=A0A6A5VJP2_9PLEO|nr:hypothetical protein BU23DRAFT_133263 [Bimuria novae-zelandiae CBS 107.79]
MEVLGAEAVSYITPSEDDSCALHVRRLRRPRSMVLAVGVLNPRVCEVAKCPRRPSDTPRQSRRARPPTPYLRRWPQRKQKACTVARQSRRATARAPQATAGYCIVEVDRSTAPHRERLKLFRTTTSPSLSLPLRSIPLPTHTHSAHSHAACAQKGNDLLPMIQRAAKSCGNCVMAWRCGCCRER